MNGRKKMGLLLIIIGIFLILSQLQIIDINLLIRQYWPSLIIIYGIYKFIEYRSINATGMSFLVVGIILQVWHLDLLPGQFREYIWPTILIVIGISLIFSQNSSHSKKNKFREDNFIDYLAILSSLETINASTKFKGGNITSILGGTEVDLTNCRIEGNYAEITATAIMGGIDLKVPKDWKVVVTGIPFLGGWDNKTFFSPEQEKTLYIRCFAILGGVEIIN